MKTLKTLFVLLAVSLGFAACSSDDGDSSNLESYIVGSWHSYYATYSANGKTVELDITKTNEMSAAYYEVNFKDDNTVTASYYKVIGNTSSKWVTEETEYSVKDNVVTIESNDGDLDLIYEPSQARMYARLVQDVSGIGTVTMFVYLKK